MATTHCTECDEIIELAGRGRIGQKVVCPHCAAALEVVAVEPLELDLAQDDDDDGWEDDLDAFDGDDENDDEEDAALEDDFDDEADDLDDDFDDDDFEDGDDDGYADDDDDRVWT